MDAAESSNATSESGTLSPAHFTRSRKRKHSWSTDHPTREYGLMRDTGSHDTARFVGSGSGIHFIRGVYVRLARKSALRTSQSNRINDLVPGEDDQLHPETSSRDGDEQNLWQGHELLQDAQGGDANPSFEQLVEWSKSYFEAWHPTLPFLSAPDVLGLLEKVSAAGPASLSNLERSIVKSIMSISLADSRQRVPFAQPVPSSLVFRTVDEAMSASQFTLCQPASIQATQAALAIQLFLVSMLRLNSASRLGGLIVRMAFHLGLHRCPSRYPFFTKEEANMRRRVFWSVYCTERLLSQALGLPLDIRDDDVDVCYPGEERHGALSDEDEDGRLQLLMYLAKHARIRGLILELRNKSIRSRDDTADRASYVQAELAKWSNEIHDAVEVEPAYEETASPLPISPSHRLFLLVLKHESMISLNRPMMTSDPSSPAYSTGLQNCIFAAKSIFIALKRHQNQNKIPNDPTSACLLEPMIQPSFTWAVWISAFILIYAAVERELPLASALKHVESGKDILRHIASRNTSWPEYCLSTIDDLTVAVRELSVPPNSPCRNPITHNPTSSGHLRPDANRSASLSSSSGRPGAPHTRARFFPSVAASTGRLDEQGLVSTPGGQSRFQAAALQDSPSFDAQPVSIPVAVASFPSATIDATETAPGEGQESIAWYDQLFANSFGAIDYPFLAAAQFDPSVDPTWSYLR